MGIPSVALVTGATQGIGRAITERLAAEGYSVGVNGPEQTPQMADVVRAVDGFGVPADISDPDAVAAAITQVEEQHGPVSALVCNAAYMSMAALVDHDADDWWKVVDTNLSGTFHTIQAVLPGMRRLGGGRIVIIASEWGVTGWPRATAYAASKAGLIALTKTLGRELARENIVVNAVAPGVIDTPQLEVDAADEGVSVTEMHRRYALGIPVGRIGRPGEIADTVAFLVSPRIGALVGQTIQINGGTTRCRV
ncbi:SDR family oxidoreductase [Mycolicibacterium helvum]|uniref:3-oxoacyl-[acyl-carrier-protein] reductase MabA n=1 Tax=Mycolicibacterium helvum TaxID=1534349 RepID=A0A7I7T461_9MYCO|nr:SDR family oxidoreductase [Mycolicibacterium helvum]BBY64084.1 3-oxoacyl-ACP reductase [Mycolicibacterium helvum]